MSNFVAYITKLDFWFIYSSIHVLGITLAIFACWRLIKASSIFTKISFYLLLGASLKLPQFSWIASVLHDDMLLVSGSALAIVMSDRSVSTYEKLLAIFVFAVGFCQARLYGVWYSLSALAYLIINEMLQSYRRDRRAFLSESCSFFLVKLRSFSFARIFVLTTLFILLSIQCLAPIIYYGSLHPMRPNIQSIVSPTVTTHVLGILVDLQILTVYGREILPNPYIGVWIFVLLAAYFQIRKKSVRLEMERWDTLMPIIFLFSAVLLELITGYRKSIAPSKLYLPCLISYIWYPFLFTPSIKGIEQFFSIKRYLNESIRK
ncbi:MAG: hypothetical protein AAF620_14105 [Bacteroidota bacterium]